MRRLILFAMLSMAAMGAAKDKGPADGLSPKLHEVIENVEAAYGAGDIEKVWHLLAGPANGLNGNTATKFDEALAAKKLPLARDLLVQARLKLLMENRTADLPAPSLRERLLILAVLQDYLQNPLEQIAGQSLLQNDAPIPKNMDEFDRRFHDIHEVQGKLRLAKICAGYAGNLAGKVPAASRKKLTDKEQETISKSEGDLLKKVQDAEQDVRELELETRLSRLKYGVEVLQQKQLTKEKFIAAATTRQDARALKQEFDPPTPVPAKGAKAKAAAAKAAASPPPLVFHRAALTSPDLANEVATLARHADEAARELADKAGRFYAGLEFWLRGRYGWGPDVGGLAKSSAALEQPELLQQLYMPENVLTPADEKEKPKQEVAGRRPETRPGDKQERKVPTCPDRRHHYTWAWEDRQVFVSASSSFGPHPIQGFEDNRGRFVAYDGVVFGKPMVDAQTGRPAAQGTPAGVSMRVTTRTVTVPPQDPRLVYRIVGFFEYSRAVTLLDKFVEEASIAEFEIGEEIIRSQEAFRIDTNLSRKIEGPSTLSEQSPNPRDDFSRHGLEWMLALARVELGAMLAGFTSHEDPFLCLAPTTFRQERVKTRPFGTAAYGELLLDGLRGHYWSLVRADVIGNYYKTGVPESHLLTFGRRAILGRHFLKAVLKYGGAGSDGENLPPAQRAELQTWEATFEKLQRMVLYCVTFKVGSEKTTDTLYQVWWRNNETVKTERDPTPEKIRRALLLLDPTLAACGCK